MTGQPQASPWSRLDTAGVSAVTAILAATALLGVGPPIVESMSREELRRKVEGVTAQAESTIASVQRVRTEKDAIDRRLEESRVTLLPIGQLNQRVMSIVNLATQAGLDIGQVTPGQQTNVRQSQVVRMTVTGTGGYRQISDFLAAVHAQFLDVVVAGFSVDARRAADDVVRGSVVFDLDWYAAPAGPEAARSP